MTVFSKHTTRLAMVLVTTAILSACAAPQGGPMCPMKRGHGSCCEGMAKDGMKGSCDMPCCQGK
jgi:hypothetical protein